MRTCSCACACECGMCMCMHVHMHAHTCVCLLTDPHVPRAAAAIVPLEGGVKLRESKALGAVRRRELLKAGGVALAIL